MIVIDASFQQNPMMRISETNYNITVESLNKTSCIILFTWARLLLISKYQ